MSSFIKRADAQVTVFAAMIFSIVVSLIVATINSAAFSVGFLRADLITYAGVSSEFSQFFRPLAENFNIFGLEIVDDMNKEMESYMQRSIEKDTGLPSVKLSGVTIKNGIKMTDNCGLPIKEQVLKYMKYGAASDFINVLTGNEGYKKKCDTVKALNDRLMEGAEIIIRMNSSLIMAASAIDGIGAENGSFCVHNNGPVYSGGDFLKMAAGNVNPPRLGITDARVYTAVSNKCEALNDLLIKTALEIYSDMPLGECGTLLNNLVRRAADAGKLALNHCRSYQEQQKKLSTFLNDYDAELEKNKEIIGDEIFSGFKDELSEMSMYANGRTKEIFDVELMISALERNIQSLEVIRELILKFRYADYEEALLMVSEIAGVIADYTCADMVIDYSDIRFVKENGAMALLRGLYDNIGKSVTEIVAEGQQISTQKVNLSTLAMSKYSVDKDKAAAANTSAIEKAFFVEYLGNNFDSFADSSYDDGGLKYDLEFILAGGSSDYDNFSKVVHGMVSMREGVNLISLFTDGEKKQQAYAMSATLLGFTGSSGLIKIGQYLIMTAWAYSESIMDVKRLVNGDKLDLFKSQSDWKMTLPRVIGFDYSYEKDSKNSGFGYGDYLKMLLMICRESRLYYATMSSMEMRLIALGYEKFRMENFLYEMTGQADFIIRDKVYEKQFSYRY